MSRHEVQTAIEAAGSSTVATSAISAQMALALDHMAQGLVIYDQSHALCYANARYCEIYGFSKDSFPLGVPIAEIHALQAAGMGLVGDAAKDYVHSCTSQIRSPYSGIRELPDGRHILVERRTVDDGFTIATHEDVTDRVGVEDRIRFAATHDPLTKLPNRATFLERLQAAMTRVERGDKIAVLMIDLDRFKAINDTYGHAFGDKLLVDVADRLQNTVRKTDTVCRLGGDEFAVLQIPSAEPLHASRLAERIIEKLSQPYLIDSTTVMIGASVGVALATEPNASSEVLIQRADFALYQSKNEGRGTFRFFEPVLDAKMKKRRQMEADMRRALVLGEFELHYQPIVNMERKRVETLEALLRWKKDGEWVSPGQFIPVAEECGLIVALGDWVLHQACIEACKWPEHITVAVNVSPLQFQGGSITDVVESALTESGLPPHRLEIEVTESLLLTKSADVLNCLNLLRGMGIGLALDDFGTGYSSLNYLTSYPFNKLKIDRSFISGVPEPGGKHPVLSAIANLGRNLGLRTTIEGVETIDQLLVANSERCSDVQGFIFARPSPACELQLSISHAEELAEKMLIVRQKQWASGR